MTARRVRGRPWAGVVAAVLLAAPVTAPLLTGSAPQPAAAASAAPVPRSTASTGAALPPVAPPDAVPDTQPRPASPPPAPASPAPAPAEAPVASDTRRSSTEPASRLAAGGIPATALDAYTRAASAGPCDLGWELVAAIGRVESNHGRFAGAVLHTDGLSTPPIVGLRLDGAPGTAVVLDTDGGRLDGDPRFDRAVGPMQFIPASWARYAADGDGDGQRDPFDLDDAAMAAARYLCAAGGDLSEQFGRARAVFAYNHSADYVATVLALAAAYAGTPPPAVPDPAPAPAPAVEPAHPGPPPALGEEPPVTAADAPAPAPEPLPAPEAPPPAQVSPAPEVPPAPEAPLTEPPSGTGGTEPGEPPADTAPPTDAAPPNSTPPSDAAPPSDTAPPPDSTPPSDSAPPSDTAPPPETVPPSDTPLPADVTPSPDTAPPPEESPPPEPEAGEASDQAPPSPQPEEPAPAPTPAPATCSNAPVRVDVLDGTGSTDGSEVAAALEAAGFLVGTVADGAARSASAVEYPGDRSAEARALAVALGVEAIPSAAVEAVTVALGVDDVQALLAALPDLPAPPADCPAPAEGDAATD